MARVSPLMILPPVIFGAFAVLAYVGMFREDPQGLPSTRVGQPAPPITDVPLAGYPAFSPEMLTSGEVTLVNFWASWCPAVPDRTPHTSRNAGRGHADRRRQYPGSGSQRQNVS